jgi:hypothetical protein
MSGFEDYMKRLRKALKRAARRESLTKSCEHMIATGQLPVGGIRELYKLVTSKSDWAFSLTKQDFEMT